MGPRGTVMSVDGSVIRSRTTRSSSRSNFAKPSASGACAGGRRRGTGLPDGGDSQSGTAVQEPECSVMQTYRERSCSTQSIHPISIHCGNPQQLANPTGFGWQYEAGFHASSTEVHANLPELTDCALRSASGPTPRRLPSSAPNTRAPARPGEKACERRRSRAHHLVDV